MSSDDDGWRPWRGGPAPDVGGKKVYVRIRCMTRADALKREPQEVKYWPRWVQDGGPGDIVEVKIA